MNKENKSLVVAITGGMGCGQSSVAKFLEKRGAKIIDADSVAHRIADNNPEVKKELRHAFGRHIFYRNGKLKRKLLASIVFQDENKTQKLNHIIHPRMVAQVIEEIEVARESGNYKIIAVDAALIYELNLERMFDAVVVVSAKMSDRINRIKERDGLTPRDITARIRKQIPIEDKVKWADFVIRNDDSLEKLEQKANNLYRQLLLLRNRKLRHSGRPVHIR